MLRSAGLLDAAVLVAQVHSHLGAGREHPPDVGVLGGTAELAGKDHRHLVGTPDANVVGDQGLEEAPCPARVIEDQGPGHLHLAHRQLPPVAGRPIDRGEGCRDDAAPVVEEALHVARSKGVTDRLQSPGIRTGGEAVLKRSEADPRLRRLPLRPLVAVQPGLGRVGEVRADLDEAWAEVGIQDVEVVGTDPALLLHELEADRPRLVGSVPGPEDPLELLSGHDGHHAMAALPLRSLQVGPDMIQLAVIPPGAVRLLQSQHRDPVLSGEGLDLLAEAVADLLEESRRGHGVAQVSGQERHHLAAHLQVGNVGVQVQAIDAFDF